MIVSVCMFNAVFELMSLSYNWLQIVTIRKVAMSQGATTRVYLLSIKTAVFLIVQMPEIHANMACLAQFHSQI